MPPKIVVSTRGRNWGSIQINESNHTVELADDNNSGPIATISKESIAGISRKTGDISLQIKRAPGPVTNIVLTDIRFALPKVVAGYEESPDATKEIATMISERVLGQAVGADGAPKAATVSGRGAAAAGGGGAASSDAAVGAGVDPSQVGPLLAEFKDVTLTQPNGLFNLVVFQKAIRVVDSKKGIANSFTILNADVSRMMTLAVRDDKTVSYAILVFKHPIKSIGQTMLRCLVCLIANEDQSNASFTDESPLVLGKDFSSIEKLKSVFGDDKVVIDSAPNLVGSFSDVLFKVLKTAIGCSLVGTNTEVSFRSVPTGSKAVSALASNYKSVQGTLYVMKGAFVFVHRNSVFVPFDAIDEVSFESLGPDTFTMNVSCTLPGNAKSEVVKFISIAKSDMLNLITYLKSKPAIKKINERVKDALAGVGDDDDDDDDEEGSEGGDSRSGSEGEDEDEDDDEDEDEDDSDEDDDDESDDSDRKKKKKKASKGADKKKKDKKEKKSKKEKKEKKEKKSKKDKKESGKRRDRDD